jgi:hypothetical protein
MSLTELVQNRLLLLYFGGGRWRNHSMIELRTQGGRAKSLGLVNALFKSKSWRPRFPQQLSQRWANVVNKWLILFSAPSSVSTVEILSPNYEIFPTVFCNRMSYRYFSMLAVLAFNITVKFKLITTLLEFCFFARPNITNVTNITLHTIATNVLIKHLIRAKT